MERKKIGKMLAFGMFFYSLSILISHTPLAQTFISPMNDFLSGVGVALIILGIVPTRATAKIKNYKNSLFYNK